MPCARPLPPSGCPLCCTHTCTQTLAQREAYVKHRRHGNAAPMPLETASIKVADPRIWLQEMWASWQAAIGGNCKRGGAMMHGCVSDRLEDSRDCGPVCCLLHELTCTIFLHACCLYRGRRQMRVVTTPLQGRRHAPLRQIVRIELRLSSGHFEWSSSRLYNLLALYASFIARAHAK